MFAVDQHYVMWPRVMLHWCESNILRSSFVP